MKALTAALLLAGCASMHGGPEPAPIPAAAAELREPGGRMVARAQVMPMGDGVHVRLQATGLAPGRYGTHIHMTGRCQPPSFESAGAHWNPTRREHGSSNPGGHHLGDLPNLEIGANGMGRLDFHVAGAALRGGPGALLDADGAAIVIHAGADDYRTDPSGNSGARIACGVLR